MNHASIGSAMSVAEAPRQPLTSNLNEACSIAGALVEMAGEIKGRAFGFTPTLAGSSARDSGTSAYDVSRELVDQLSRLRNILNEINERL